MGVLYHARLGRSAAGLDPWVWVADWWEQTTGVRPAQPDGPFVSGYLAASYGRLESDSGTVVEITVSDDSSGVTTSLIDWSTPDGRTLFVEESSRSLPEFGAQLPRPSTLVGAVVKAALLEQPQQSPFGQVLLVGALDRHAELRGHLDERTLGMLSWRVASVAFASEAAKVGVSEGAVVLLLEGGVTPLALPVMWVRSNPEPTARRLQTEAVRVAALKEFPPALSHALRELRSVGRGADEWAAIAEELDERNRVLVEQIDHALRDHDLALRELDEVQRRLSFLEREFRQRGEIVPDIEEEEDELPLDVDSSVAAMKYAHEYLKGVQLSSGADDRCGELDAQHSVKVTARRAWRALRALDSYVDAKAKGEIVGSFLHFCQDAPAGRVAFPPGDVALTESEACLGNPVTRAARVFPVPTSVDPAGQLLMAAHIKVAGVGNLAARLHFYDDTAGPTGKVHVGYFGPHLPLP